MKSKKINILKFHKYISNEKISIVLNGHFDNSIIKFSNCLLANIVFDRFYYINYNNLSCQKTYNPLDLLSFKCSCCGKLITIVYEKNIAFIRQPNI